MKPLAPVVALIIAALPAHAGAGEARASGNAYVRSGPGSQYVVVGNLKDGAYYEVVDCTRRAAWCLVAEDDELLGWVRGSSLVGSAAKVRVTPFEFQVTPEFFKK